MTRDHLGMIVVEARHPTTGKKFGQTDVDLSTSGLLIWLFDENDNALSIHRYAWDGVVKAVEELFAKEKHQSEESLAKNDTENDGVQATRDHRRG